MFVFCFLSVSFCFGMIDENAIWDHLKYHEKGIAPARIEKVDFGPAIKSYKVRIKELGGTVTVLKSPQGFMDCRFIPDTYQNSKEIIKISPRFCNLFFDLLENDYQLQAQQREAELRSKAMTAPQIIRHMIN